MTAENGLPILDAVRQQVLGKAFSVVVRAREALFAGQGVSRKTALLYASKSAQMFAELERSGLTIRSLLGRYAPVPKTFYLMRAALVFHCKQGARDILINQSNLQRQSRDSEAWLAEVDRLRRALVVIDNINSFKIEHFLKEMNLPRKQSHSKRKDLIKLPKNWKEQMLALSIKSPAYYLPTIVLAATGCRPAELAVGVELKISGEDVAVRIFGVKVSEASGQQWRQFNVRRSVFPSNVLDQIEKTGLLRVQIKNPDAFRTHLTRHSTALFPGMPAVTAYTFRHSLAEDLREAGWSAEELAGLLGHATSEMQRNYGRRRRAGSRAPKESTVVKKSVETARAIPALDRSGLNKINSQKAKAFLNSIKSK